MINAPEFALNPPQPAAWRRAAAGLLLICTLPGSAAAEATDWEITPTLAYRADGETTGDFSNIFTNYDIDESESYGLTVERRLTDNLRLELLWNTQSSELRERRSGILMEPEFFVFDLDIDYYHVGLMHQWDPGNIKPFLVGSVGVTRFAPDSSEFESASRFSASVGGGAKFMFSRNVGLRLEGRLYSTWLRSSDEFYCRASCRNLDDILFQAEGRAGLIIAF
ncbi:MAG: outer membrane beta-barrel protein [Acidobacteriota bacterium]